MKKIIIQYIIPIFLFLSFGFGAMVINKWSTLLANKIMSPNPVVLPEGNTYQKKETFLFVQETTDFVPLSKEDIKNIFYTIVNHGIQKFTFYCPNEYSSCITDVKSISQDQDLLTHLNNFVHPYNGFSNVQTIISESGEITISVIYFYDQDMITKINQKVDDIYNEVITSDMDNYTKILTIHDYIINHTKYDVERNDKGNSNYHSYIAYGPLFEGFATCNGYTDAMALFLEKMNIPNFKVAMTPDNTDSEGHVWNAVYLNNKWLHLDLTWDDPVSSDGKDYLEHRYFLITTNELKKSDNGEVKITEHQYKTNIYLELK